MVRNSLSPELKAIYEKVMNTPTRPLSGPPPTATQTVSQPPRPLLPEKPYMPVIPSQPSQIPGVSPVNGDASPLPPKIPHTAPKKQFVFTNNSGARPVTADHMAASTYDHAAHIHSRKKLIVFVSIVFLVGYLAFWLVFFGFI